VSKAQIVVVTEVGVAVVVKSGVVVVTEIRAVVGVVSERSADKQQYRLNHQ
jgi:hypothetical protein